MDPRSEGLFAKKKRTLVNYKKSKDTPKRKERKGKKC